MFVLVVLKKGNDVVVLALSRWIIDDDGGDATELFFFRIPPP